MSARTPSLAFSFSVVSLLALGQAQAQESRARFDAAVVVADQWHSLTHLLDLDGNGVKDAIGFWSLNDSTRYTHFTGYRNDGSGRLEEAWDFPLGTWLAPTILAVANLDGDGRDDFVIAKGHQVHLFTSNGFALPVYRQSVNPVTPGDIRSLVAADFDADGLDDFAVFTSSYEIKVFLNRRNDPPVLSSTTYTSISGPTDRMFLTEFNGDGRPDLVVTSSGLPAYVRLYSVEAGVISEGPQFIFSSSLASPMIASGDVDGDGDTDIVAFGMSQYEILRRSGLTTFTLEGPRTGGPATDLADVDGDGDLDGVCCGGGGGGGGGGSTPSPNVNQAVFEVSLNDGGGSFAAAFKIPGLGAEHIAGAADMDGDGDVDLVAGRCVYFAHGPLRNPYPRIPFAGTAPPRPAPIGDFDGDADVDVDLTLESVCANSADGTFRAQVTVRPQPPAGRNFTGRGMPIDADGDGHIDLLVELRGSGGTLLSMRLLRNAGGGGFVDGGDATAPGETFDVGDTTRQRSFCADVDTDGDLDLVLGNYWFTNEPPTEIWLNDGSGFFTRGAVLLAELLVRVAGLDGDGISDQLRGARAQRFMRLYRGLSNGTFGNREALPILSYQAIPAVADFDGDGDLDIAGHVTVRSDAALLLNDGSAHFQEAIRFPLTNLNVTISEHHLLATDVDLDGRMDLIASQAGDEATLGTSSIFIQTPGALAFTSSVQVFHAAQVADSDGDGDPDLLSATARADGQDAVPDFLSDHFVPNRRFEMPWSGKSRQYGSGTPGSGGMAPVLGALGVLRPGGTWVYRVMGGIGGSTGYLAVGLEPLEEARRGGILLVNPLQRHPITLNGTTGEPGTGSWEWLQGPLPHGRAGRSYYLQAFVRDPEAPQGLSFSNGLKVTFGH